MVAETITTQTRLTYEEYLKEPYTMSRFDIVDGEVIMSAGPTRPHQIISGNVYRPLHRFASEGGWEKCCMRLLTSS